MNNYKLSFIKTGAPESYTSGSDVDQESYKNLNFWDQEDRNLPFAKDEYPGESTQEYKKPPQVFQELDHYPDQAYDGVQANLKLSFNELPNAEEISFYDYGPETIMNDYPSKKKDNWDYKQRNSKGDEEIIFEKGTHQSVNRPETDRPITPYGSQKLSWDVYSDKEISKNSLFIYLKPTNDLPFDINEAYVTLLYSDKTVKDEDRQKVIKKLSNLLKKYKKSKSSFNGVATFNNDDNSKVILINIENGAELRSEIVDIVKDYTQLTSKYDFIPHMTTNKGISVNKLPNYSWVNKSIYIEFEKDIPAISIDFKTGVMREVENLRETSSKDVDKLSRSIL